MAPFRDRLQDYDRLVAGEDRVHRSRQGTAGRAEYEIPAYGTIAIEHKGRIERDGQGEQELTNAIIKVTSDSQKKIYFVQGHGEHDTASADEQRGYSIINDALGKENFSIAKLVLVQAPTVPEDAAVVIVAGPQSDYLPPEIDALRAYLNKAARSCSCWIRRMRSIRRRSQPDRADQGMGHRRWRQRGNRSQRHRPARGPRSGHADRHRLSVASDHRSLQQHHDGLPAGPLGHALVGRAIGTHGADDPRQTSKASWAESDVKRWRNGVPSASTKRAATNGPISLAAVISTDAPDQPPAPAPGTNGATPPNGRTRVVVFGDSDFPANGNLAVQGNENLFLNTVNWLGRTA